MAMSPAERLRRNAERRRVVHAETTCVRCDKPFVPTRSDALYCSNRCRQAAHRTWRWSEEIDRHNAVLEAEGVAGFPMPSNSRLGLVASIVGSLLSDGVAITPKAVSAHLDLTLPGWLKPPDAKIALAWLKADAVGRRWARHSRRWILAPREAKAVRAWLKPEHEGG
jgi:hypothetical protein